MRKKGSKKEQLYRVDEHDMPTEPLPDPSAILFPTPDQSGSRRGQSTVAPPFAVYLDPRQPPPAYPYIQAPTSGMGGYPSYPVWPRSPSRTSYGGWPTNAAWSPVNAKKQRTRRKSVLPACVGLFFLCVQLLLVVRLGVRFLNLSPDITWVAFVTDVSYIFVLPFQLLWLQIPVVSALLPANMEVYTLIAILVYRVLSRLLVGILKVILKSR